MLVVLLLLLAGATTWQLLLASQDRAPYPVPATVTPSP